VHALHSSVVAVVAVVAVVFVLVIVFVVSLWVEKMPHKLISRGFCSIG